MVWQFFFLMPLAFCIFLCWGARPREARPTFLWRFVSSTKTKMFEHVLEIILINFARGWRILVSLTGTSSPKSAEHTIVCPSHLPPKICLSSSFFTKVCWAHHRVPCAPSSKHLLVEPLLHQSLLSTLCFLTKLSCKGLGVKIQAKYSPDHLHSR